MKKFIPLIFPALMLLYSTAIQSQNVPDNIFDSKPSIFAQDDDHQGFYFAAGYFAGYSTHAATYMAVDQGVPTTYTGFRALNLDVRGGWGINDRAILFGTIKASPGSSTISYYHSLYGGGALAYYLGKRSNFALHAGAGYYNAKIRRGIQAGKGVLFNLGAGYEISRHFTLETMILAGKLSGNDAYPFPFRSNELNTSLGVFWVLY